MPKIAISYRRTDSDATGRIFDRLVMKYGKDSVFRDIDNIPLGADFRKYIDEALRETDIFIAIVGPGWLGKRGLTRIRDEVDPVRIEVEAALRRDISIIPVLVGGSNMPKPAELPDSIKDFAFRNAAKIDAGQDFDHHIDRLIRSLDRILEGKTRSASQNPVQNDKPSSPTAQEITEPPPKSEPAIEPSVRSEPFDQTVSSPSIGESPSAPHDAAPDADTTSPQVAPSQASADQPIVESEPVTQVEPAQEAESIKDASPTNEPSQPGRRARTTFRWVGAVLAIDGLDSVIFAIGLLGYFKTGSSDLQHLKWIVFGIVELGAALGLVFRPRRLTRGLGVAVCLIGVILQLPNMSNLYFGTFYASMAAIYSVVILVTLAGAILVLALGWSEDFAEKYPESDVSNKETPPLVARKPFLLLMAFLGFLSLVRFVTLCTINPQVWWVGLPLFVAVPIIFIRYKKALRNDWPVA